MKSLFEKIADKEIPSYTIWEDDNFLAFLDIMPLSKGQTLVVPKKNWSDNIFHLNDSQFTQLMMAAKTTASILENKLKLDRVFMLIEGLEVPHVHIKLIPSDNGELNSLTRYSATNEELKQVHKQLTN